MSMPTMSSRRHAERDTHVRCATRIVCWGKIETRVVMLLQVSCNWCEHGTVVRVRFVAKIHLINACLRPSAATALE